MAAERATAAKHCPNRLLYFSLAGGLTLLAYSIHRRDPVFITGQAAGTFIYLRNLYFIRKGKAAKASAMAPQPPQSILLKRS